MLTLAAGPSPIVAVGYGVVEGAAGADDLLGGALVDEEPGRRGLYGGGGIGLGRRAGGSRDPGGGGEDPALCARRAGAWRLTSMLPLELPARSPRVHAFSEPWSGAGVAERKMRLGSQAACTIAAEAGPPRFS